MIFIIFQIFVKFGKKWRFFGKKSAFFRFYALILFRDFRRKVYAFLGKWPNWPNFLYKWSLGYLLQSWVPFFYIWCFSHFMNPIVCQGGLFWPFFAVFLLKNVLSTHTGACKMAKTPNIQKRGPNFVVSNLRNIYTKN